MKIRIGTRTSLMAMAQAKIVASLLHARYPGIETELVGIVPIGDQDKTTPLPQMNAIGIFSKEIDDRLLAGDIDCAVHSLKDLGTQRPHGIARAAILTRDDPHDIILFHPDILDRLKNADKIVIGTSAPRRAELLPGFLRNALPTGSVRPEIELKPIRGNANSRIAKLRDDAQSLDGIVLALAGLERLYNDSDAHGEVTRLLSGLKRMIVPLTVCPPAPGQGTICIEALQDRADIIERFSSLNDAVAQAAIDAEYEILTANGGGCHQRFGTLSLTLPALKGPCLIVRGKNKDGDDISATHWQAPQAIGHASFLNASELRHAVFSDRTLPAPQPSSDCAFVAHSRAVPDGFRAPPHLWVSGVESWYKLAARGHWVEGCADGFGADFIARTIALPVLGLRAPDAWDILSHRDAREYWPRGNFIATYVHEKKPLSPETFKTLENRDVFWWPSASLYHALKPHLPQHGVIHCCGAGKTAQILLELGVTPLYVFPEIKEFYRWMNTDDRSTRPADADTRFR